MTVSGEKQAANITVIYHSEINMANSQPSRCVANRLHGTRMGWSEQCRWFCFSRVRGVKPELTSRSSHAPLWLHVTIHASGAPDRDGDRFGRPQPRQEAAELAMIIR
jgi:hypothetical protein